MPLTTEETTSTNGNLSLMAESGNALYLLIDDRVFVSMDRGENWRSLGTRPKGRAVGLVATDEGLYLALENQIFRFEVVGKHWTPLYSGVPETTVLAIATVENTVFVGMNHGLYRFRAARWKKLALDTTKAISSLAVSGSDLYVGTGSSLSHIRTSGGLRAYTNQLENIGGASPWAVYRSEDLGESWTEITPTSDSFIVQVSPGIKVFASGSTVLVTGATGFRFRSNNRGEAWTEFGTDKLNLKSMMDTMVANMFPTVAVDEKTFLQSGFLGLTRSTDGGKSWQPFMKGIVGTNVLDLVAFRNALYTNTGSSIAKSVDGGESWRPLRVVFDESTRTSTEKLIPNDLLMAPKLVISGNNLYAIAPTATRNTVRISRLAEDSRTFVPFQDIPSFDRGLGGRGSETTGQEGAKNSKERGPTSISGFAVSAETFYVVSNGQLLRWRRDESEWFNTQLIDTDGNAKSATALKLAVSGEVVYVGKQDGHLWQSVDGGNTWKKVTSSLPLQFTAINDIVISNSAVYIATDAGVLTSKNGEYWQTLTDRLGNPTLIDRIAVDATDIYGVGSEGTYRLDSRRRWEQLLPGIPNKVVSLVVSGPKLYIATKERGIFYASVETR